MAANLRRIAQVNAASGSSPRTITTDSDASAPPSTPRNRVSEGYYRSPASTPSISSSIPFDWHAARSSRPPPYATPAQKKSRQSIGVGSPATKRVIRKKGIIQRIRDIPSRIAFEIAIFPQNVPLPAPKMSAWLIGGAMHFCHFCIRVSQTRKVPDSDTGWEDMYREDEGHSWFDWTVPTTFLLMAASFLNTLYVFTRIKLYRLHHRADPVSSPHATFVEAQLDFEPLDPPSLFSRTKSFAWRVFSHSWRFLLGMQPPASSSIIPGRISRVQQLDVWTPGELEMMLFCVYSPAHVFLWMATGSGNWIIMIFVMGMVGIQLNMLPHSYEALMKDKDIISAEVMHEYNEGFVYPRMNPVRKDVAVMTHQSEVVDVWED